MVLLARPAARVTALDIYKGTEYGIDDNTPDRLLANAKVAGVADRVDVKVADMRQMPFRAARSTPAVSAYAIDHLPKDGVERARWRRRPACFAPRGQFLLMALNVDGWVRFAFPVDPRSRLLRPRAGRREVAQCHDHGWLQNRRSGDAAGDAVFACRAESGVSASESTEQEGPQITQIPQMAPRRWLDRLRGEAAGVWREEAR